MTTLLARLLDPGHYLRLRKEAAPRGQPNLRFPFLASQGEYDGSAKDNQYYNLGGFECICHW
jgi:hypothetical protein